jgi:hypothetical protein
MDFFTNTVPKATASTASKFGLGTLGTPLLYVLLVIFVVAIVFMLMNIKISLSSFIPRSWTVTSQSHRFMKPLGSFTNLKVTSSQGPTLSETSYSMTIEGLLFNTRNYQTTDGPYRHLLHRGSKELEVTTIGGTVLSGCAASGNYGDLPPFGLPKRLNPGIFLDPNTNDILVFIDTVDGAKTYRESVRVADIPLDTPFRLAVILNGRILEVYFNCGLEATKVLSGIPRVVENVWYGLSGSAAADAQIQNLDVWTFGLTAEDIRPRCPKPPTFSKLRPQCNGADKPVPKPSMPTPGQVSTDLGFGLTLNTCSPN